METASFTLRRAVPPVATVLLLAAFAAAPAHAGTHDYNYDVSFTTPASFLGTGSGDALFLFNPSGPSPAPASAIGSKLSYSNDWTVNPFGITLIGDASFDFFSQSVQINNTNPQNGFSLPVTKWGTNFGFHLEYLDPPGTDPSDFSVTLQKTGLPDTVLFDIQFNPSGAATLESTLSGVVLTPGTGTPDLLSPRS